MELSKLRYRDLIVVLMYELRILCDLFEGDEKYLRLLQVLREYDIERDSLPYQKDLVKRLGMPRPKLMNLLQGLYEDFQMKLCNPKAYQISDSEIWLQVKSREDYWVIGMDGLEIIPRVGENFALYFIRGENHSGYYFKVESIMHEIENGVHKVFIDLNDGK